MSNDSYDEAEVLKRYVTHNFYSLLTDFEGRCLELAAKREKATASKSLADRLPELQAKETEDVRRASLAGHSALWQRFEDRINREIRDGTLSVNRCPKCRRIVRTPLAKQCLWCGHDWHGA
jgi:hypothetical protein